MSHVHKMGDPMLPAGETGPGFFNWISGTDAAGSEDILVQNSK